MQGLSLPTGSLHLALVASLAALLCVAIPGMAAAKPRLKIFAPSIAAAPGQAPVAVRARGGVERVVFSVDGRRRWVDRSPRRRFGRRGSLDTAGLAAGRHRLQAKAKLRGGRVLRSARTIYIAKNGMPSPGKRREKPRGRPVPTPDPEPDAEPTPEPQPETEPTPEPEPVTEPGAALLDAGFENGLDGWNTAGMGEIEPAVVSDIVRDGSRSARFALSGSQNRSELILGGDGSDDTDEAERFREGDERWYGFSFYVERMVYGRPGAHNLIMQLKGNDGGSPYFGLQLWDYEGDDGHSGGRGLWSHGEGMGGDRFLSPLAERSWHDVAIRFKASAHGAGSYEVYLDGSLVDSRYDTTLIPPGATHDYIKDGLYRNGGSIPGRSEIRFDAARLGATRASVEPR